MLAGLPVAIALLAVAANAVPAVPPNATPHQPPAVPATAPAHQPPAASIPPSVPADPPPAAAVSVHPLYGPPEPATARPKPVKVAAAVDPCAAVRASSSSREIVICAQQGYRLNPDVMKAKRQAHNGGPPRRPENFKYNNCATVGPMGCMGQNQPMIDLFRAANTLATMAKRLSSGQEIGSMFITDPQPTEYQLYVQAKHDREAKEAEVAAIAAAKAKAAQPAGPTPPATRAASSAPSAVQAQPAAAEPTKSTH
jgi:hypothetical protein